ncbi:uncharacterized protein [Aristolochia californica]|uniref:uncharacterized protein n=1 Tax=Aristolochia californica TaxID=171875 RepID=UPI0035E34F9D
MDSTNGGRPVQPQILTQEALSLLGEGISLVLSRWTALQMAIENEWGGKDSRQKSSQLASDILSWFAQSKETHYIDDLENILDESMVLSFNTEIEDGSVEEIAERLMIMHEDCLQGNFDSVEKLRNSSPSVNAVSESRQVIVENADESSDEEDSAMTVDLPKTRLSMVEPNPKPKNMTVYEPNMKGPEDADDGWTVVPSRRNRGQKSC